MKEHSYLLLVWVLILPLSMGCQSVSRSVQTNAAGQSGPVEFAAVQSFGPVSKSKPKVNFNLRRSADSGRPAGMQTNGSVTTFALRHDSGRTADVTIGLESTNQLQQIGFIKREKPGRLVAIVAIDGAGIGQCILNNGKTPWFTPHARKVGQSVDVGAIHIGANRYQVHSVCKASDKPKSKFSIFDSTPLSSDQYSIQGRVVATRQRLPGNRIWFASDLPVDDQLCVVAHMTHRLGMEQLDETIANHSRNRVTIQIPCQ